MSMEDHAEVFRHDGFGRKLGPLPIWGWAIVLAAGVFVYVKFFAGSGSSAGSPATSVTGQALPNIMTTGGYLPASSGSAPAITAGGSAYTDNQSWENAALQSASAYGSTPVSLQQALDAYLNGSTKPLTSSQQSVIDRVIQSLGAPPLGTQGTPVTASGAPSLVGFIHDPSGTISALFSNNTVSQYTNLQTFQTAQKAAGAAVPVSNVTAQQIAGYSKVANNYQPGWSAN